MPVSFLIRHWKKELQVFHENLLILQRTFNSEAIHDLRVSIKKLRSYTKLYSAIFKNDEVKSLLAETKILFSVLGRLRNIEMSIELLNRLKPKEMFTPIQKYFEFYLNETKQRAGSALQQYKTDDLRSLTIEIEKASLIVEEGSINEEIQKLVRSSVREIKKQLKDFHKNYHLVRKKLKDIFYWSQIFPGEPFFSKQELKKVKVVLDHLGDSQDHEVLRNSARHYRKTVAAKGSEAFDSVKQIEKNVKERKNALLNKAQKIIEELWGNK